MQNPLIRDYKSVVLTTDHPDETAAFYRDVLMLPIEAERHRGTHRHWAGPVGSLHFAIHPREGFWLPSEPGPGDASTVVSFTTDNLDGLVEKFEASAVEIVARTQIGPMSFIAVRDPDRRLVCFGTPWPERRAARQSAE